MYVLQHVHFWELQKLEEGVKPCEYWELNPLQEQQVLFTAVTSIQKHIFHHKKMQSDPINHLLPRYSFHSQTQLSILSQINTTPSPPPLSLPTEYI